MRIVLNGDRRELPEGATVSTAIEAAGAEGSGRGLAVAIDGEVIPRGEWATTVLAEDARVEVLQAVQGG